MKKTNNLLAATLIILTAVSCTKQDGNYWPQFRGPENNMVVKGGNLPEVWNDSTNIRWTFDMPGESWSSPIVWGDKIFITSNFLEKKGEPDSIQSPANQPVNQPRVQPGSGQTPPPPPPADNSYKRDVYRWEVTCIDAKTGTKLWDKVAYRGNPSIKKHAGSTYACETPVTDGKYVYVVFGGIGAFCYDMAGNLVWQKEIEAFETQNGWGTSSSPVLSDGLLYILYDNEVNSTLTALDAATGAEKWKVSRDEKTTYSTPVIWKNSAGIELVTLGRTARSYDPKTGSLIWELKAGGEQVIAGPVYDNNNLYLGNAGGRESSGNLYCIKAGAKGDITPADSSLVSDGVKWTVRNAGIANPSPVLNDGLIYLLSSRGGDLLCYEAETGSQVYKTKIDKVGACWASPWIYNGKLYFFDEKGVTQVARAGRDFQWLSVNTINDKFWSSIAVAENAYIFKGVKKLYCVAEGD